MLQAMGDMPPPPSAQAASQPDDTLTKEIIDLLVEKVKVYDRQCACSFVHTISQHPTFSSAGKGTDILIIAPPPHAIHNAFQRLKSQPERDSFAWAHAMFFTYGTPPIQSFSVLKEPDTDEVQTMKGIATVGGTHQRVLPDSAAKLEEIEQVGGANVEKVREGLHLLSGCKLTILCVTSSMMSIALDTPLADEQVGGLDAKCPVPPPGMNVLGAPTHQTLDVEARLYGDASGEPIRPKPTPADDARREFDGKMIPESDLFGHCPDLRLRGKTKEQQLHPAFIQKLQSGPAVRQVLQDTSPDLHDDDRIATRGSNPSNIYTPRVRLQADVRNGVRRALYTKTTTRSGKGRVVYNHADFLKIGLKPYVARLCHPLPPCFFNAVRTHALSVPLCLFPPFPVPSAVLLTAQSSGRSGA
jgi:hypothetical protein